MYRFLCMFTWGMCVCVNVYMYIYIMFVPIRKFILLYFDIIVTNTYSNKT